MSKEKNVFNISLRYSEKCESFEFEIFRTHNVFRGRILLISVMSKVFQHTQMPSWR